MVDASNELSARYRIRAPLRCDGAGRLDCAEDVLSGGRMAIRWLPLDANGAVASDVIGTLPAHRALPVIRERGKVGAAAYVAMDFPEGRLLSAMQEGALSAHALCGVGADLADALATLHAVGLIHGQLSGASVLVLPVGGAMLWDTPLVLANRLTDRRTGDRASAPLLSSSPYLSPERARGAPATPSGDVYALAALLCIAGGSRLPAGENGLGILHHIATLGWTPEVPAAFPEEVRAMLAAMLRVDPLSRPSAQEVSAALSEPWTEQPTPVVMDVHEHGLKRRAFLLGAAAGLVAMLVGTGIAAFWATGARASAGREEAPSAPGAEPPSGSGAPSETQDELAPLKEPPKPKRTAVDRRRPKKARRSVAEPAHAEPPPRPEPPDVADVAEATPDTEPEDP